MRSHFLLAALALVGALGCEDDAEPFVPPSFDRADQVALACLDVLRGEGLPLAECESETTTSDLHLLALVTQSQRGELAVVDLVADTLIDVDPQVPGFTFHPVGELPTGVAVSPDGTRAYVACSGGHSLSVFDIGTIARPEGRLDPIDLGAHVPFDVSVSEDFVFVTAPDEGLLLAVDPESGDATELPLATGADGGGDADAGVGDAGAEGDAGAADDAGVDAGAAAGDEASRPWRMTMDLEDRRLYCANAGRSVISVVDVDAVTEVDTLAIGAPTSSLAISPPRLHDDGTRWLYAVEHAAGGVRVMDLGSGAVINANRGSYERGGDPVPYDDPGETGPAIQVPGTARAVEIFSRTSEGEAAPEVLDGMFAAILSSDGLLYIVDIDDDDQEARVASADEADGYVFLPHHLRSLRRFSAADLPQLAANPTVQVEASQVICGADFGFVAHFDAPGAPACDDAGAGIDIDKTYPWQATNETWTVTYEGTIPGTVRPRGNLEGDDQLLDRAADFCALGVQPGDRLALVSTPAPATQDAGCGDEGEELSWPIAEVFKDHLVLAEPFGLDPVECGLDAWVDYRVRTSGVWTVVGTSSGFLHSIVVDEDGRCVPSEGADPRLSARAPECDAADVGEDCVFTNTVLSFTMVRGVGDNDRPVRSQVDTSWAFTTTNALDPLAIAVGSLPTSVRYLPFRDSLVVVDPVDGGLVEVSVTSLARERSFR